MPSISKDIGLQKKKRKTLRRISLLILFLLLYLVKNTPNNHLPIRVRPIKMIRTIKKVPGIDNKDKVVAMTFFPQMSTSLRGRKRISPKLNASTVGKRGIISIRIFKT